jgi:hypothetical protein
VVEEVATLLAQWLRVYSHSVAFPELALPITLSLKKFVQSHRRSSCPAPAALKRLATIQQKVAAFFRVSLFVSFFPPSLLFQRWNLNTHQLCE